MSVAEVIAAWDTPDAPLHPSIGMPRYWTSGRCWAAQVAAVVPPPASVLDFACGDGRVAVHLLESGYTVTGYDTSAVTLERFRQNCPDVVVVASLPDETYDVVLMLAVLIHYSAADGIQVLDQAWKRVASGGFIIANVRLGTEQVTGAHRINVWPHEAVALPGGVIVSETHDLVIAWKELRP